MYSLHQSSRNKWENKQIDAKNKNSHRRSHNKLPRRSSNSLKQEFRNEFNLQLFNRLYTNRSNKQYSLHHYLEYDNIYDDYEMIIDNNYNDYIIEAWSCSVCTYLNVERSSYCKICDQSYHDNYSRNASDNCSVISSDSDTSITTYSSLTSYIAHKHNKNNIKKRRKSKMKRRKFPKKSGENSFRFNDDEYKKFKKYMKKRKTSIIAYKKGTNHTNWNNVKMEKEKNNANKLFEMYQALYLSQDRNKEEVTSIVKKMAAFIPKKYLKCVLPQKSNNTVCKVCYCETKDDDEMALVAMNKYCSHCMICKECFIQYLAITIKEDENIMPWILCPALDCKAPIHIDLILTYISMDNLYKFGQSFINKHLQRNSYWIDCPDTNDKKCKFGWIVINDDNDDDHKQQQVINLECEGCGCHHTVKPDRHNHGSKDDGFSSLIASGIMRECPQCSYPAMKDYGMCNVMHCGKCGVYWNWRTKEVGSSSNEVKQRARSNGSLWEPGELSYQQNLQNNNLSEFVALLKRNGIKYDPNYRRGT